MYLFSFIYIYFIHSGCHAEFIGNVGQPTCNNWNGMPHRVIITCSQCVLHELFKLLRIKKELLKLGSYKAKLDIFILLINNMLR